MTPAPPHPFDPEIAVLAAGSGLFRVHHHRRPANVFNPGRGSATRFACFEDLSGRTVPVLYAAAGQTAAVAETLLHDIPSGGGLLVHDSYASAVMSRLVVTRDLRLGVLHGLGLRRLRVTAAEVTDSPASSYGSTVRWAEAGHRAGLDGLVWMSRQCDDTAAYVLFGDRCEGRLRPDPAFGRLFATGADLAWLIDLCAPLGVDVLPPSTGPNP